MTQPLYEMIAAAFAAEGASTVFTLMGDANMHWASAMSRQDGIRLIHVRHEHAACAAAISYGLTRDQPGIASVTCGPGFTQTMTALAMAAQAHAPLLLFAGEAPLSARFHNQRIDQPPLAAAAGVRYIQVHHPGRALDLVREAFFHARTEQAPVVLGVPTDLQKQSLAAAGYNTSATLMPKMGQLIPDPQVVQDIADRLGMAQKPIIIAGRGAVSAQAGDLIRQLATRCGALLATTMPARGLFDADPFSLGIAGGFSSDLAFSLFGDSDLVMVIGASLSNHTSHGGRLFPRAFVVQIDRAPGGWHYGLPIPDLALRCDAKVGVSALLAALPTERRGYRSAPVARRIADESEDRVEFAIGPGTLDPRHAIAALDRVIPKDWHIVSGSGHGAFFTTLMKHRPPESFHVVREFGAIGNGLAYALGIAASRQDGKVLLLEGDGGLMMHIQELETIQRHRLRLVVGAMNDGAFGAELHKFRAEGLDPAIHQFGRPDFAAIGRGFGLMGEDVMTLDDFPALLHRYETGGSAAVWNIPISDQVTSLYQRRSTH
jgi:acetolactate synthase-1/2/3 large subunit